MGFVETKKWHVFSGELLAQVMDMIGRMRRRWRPLIREENLEENKEIEDWLGGELNIIVRSIPTGLERCSF